MSGDLFSLAMAKRVLKLLGGDTVSYTQFEGQ